MKVLGRWAFLMIEVILYRGVLRRARLESALYRVTSPIRNSSPPSDHHRALGIVLLQGPRGALFLMSEVPLYISHPGFRAWLEPSVSPRIS